MPSMHLKPTMTFTTFLYIITVAVVTANADERRLLDDLFVNYNNAVRPVLSTNDTVTVNIRHTIQQILDVDERKELFHSCGWSSLRWRDFYLRWNPYRYAGIKSINISPWKIWIPDIVLYEDIGSNQVFGGHVNQMQNQLTVDHLGNVIWGLRATFITKCHFNIHDFPFDTQSCTFRYGSWSYEKGRIDISPDSHIVIDYQEAHNPGWKLLDYSSKMMCRNFSGGSYESIEFTLVFKRRAICRSLNLLLPPLIVGVLIILTFMLPAATGERLTLSVTLLLAMIFFMISVAHLIPGDDSTVPIIYKFFIITLVQIVLQLISLIFIMQLHHKRSYDPPMPGWIRRTILEKLAYWVGTRSERCMNQKFSIEIDELESIIEIGFVNCEHCQVDSTSRESLASDLLRAKDGGFSHMMREKESILKEWRVVALTVDRCLFLLYSFIYVTIIAVFSMHAIFG